MDRIECFAHYGLVARTVCCRNRRLDFAGWNPREVWVASCRTVAGALRGPCGPGGCAAPRGSCLRSGTSPWPAGNRVWPASVALAGGVPVGALRGCLRGGGRWCPRYAWCHRHLPRLHAPEPRTGAPVLASVRRASGETRTVRSNGAARVERAWVAGRIIGESGGVWQRLGGGAGGNCANAGNARPRYVGRCGAPSHSGGARHCRRVGVDGSDAGMSRGRFGAPGSPRCGQAERAGASDRDPNGPRPLAGLGRRSRLERGRRRRPDRKQGVVGPFVCVDSPAGGHLVIAVALRRYRLDELATSRLASLHLGIWLRKLER